MKVVHMGKGLMGKLFWGSAAIALASGACAGSSDGFERSHFEELTGTWRVEVTTYNCETGVTNTPFVSLLTFGAFGTLTGTTANPVFLPGQRSPDHGAWKRTGRDYFTASTEAFIEFSTPPGSPTPPLVRGSQRIEQSIELNGKDSFRSDATLTFLDAGGSVVLTGCATANATRFR
jgi:hypothetical protein